MARVYIVYNADGSAMGKIKYACSKIMSSPSGSPCAACDLTHNGLHITETSKWSSTKSRIGAAEVRQLHRDELSSELKQFIDSQKLELPIVLGQESEDDALKVLMDREELRVCSKDHEQFLAVLQENASEQSVRLTIKRKA
ncbi:hypothetical protein BJ546DRAFT_839474 [Cryomyces antarcticus]|uniref:Uncharacterized protein n=1 Tax=Cryomyces antarcticus TaxID=329879 RepID=A0ABR0LRD7_9PEZI|nr:hypothetical protein LTR39_000059 [Cryomyces antarcticus]KAK5021384.1 hypothetical protein LTR60_000028 [Cryomyces antarcticus]KAK5202163.1 hypothetical protein LTR16_000189 [Cryomyces antarcticus]